MIRYIAGSFQLNFASIFGRKSRFRDNFVKVASANAFAQALPILVAPVLTRMYHPSDFGAVALYAAILGLLLSVAAMRLDWLVSTVAGDKQAANLLVVGIIHVVLVSLTVTLIIWSGWYKVWSFGDVSVIYRHLWLLPLALVGAGIQLMLAGWFIRAADLTPLASTTIYQSIGGTSLNLVGGTLSIGALCLIFTATINSWIAVFALVRRSYLTVSSRLSQVNLQSMWLVFRQIWKKYLISGATGIVNVCGLSLPTVLISAYFTPIDLGWYALMQRLATGPISVLTGALGQSFWAEARQLVRSNPIALRTLFRKTSVKLALFSVPVGLACLSGPLYVGQILGMQKWAGAGVVLAVLTPSILSQIIVSTLSPVIVICGEEAWLFLWDISRTIIIIATFVTSGLLSIQFIYTVAFFSVVMAIMYLILFFKNMSLLNHRCDAFLISGNEP